MKSSSSPVNGIKLLKTFKKTTYGLVIRLSVSSLFWASVHFLLKKAVKHFWNHDHKILNLLKSKTFIQSFGINPKYKMPTIFGA